jgi:hypothetical protein
VTFGEVRRQLQTLVGELDARLLRPHDAVKLLAEVEQIKNLACGAEALVAPRAAESGQWQRDGHLTPESWLATKAGTTIGEAKDTIATGEKVASLPKVDDALRRGELSARQAALVADGAAANPAAQDKLIRTAQRESVKVLRDEVDRVKAAARAEDTEAEHARIHRERAYRTGKRADGSCYLSANGTPEAIAAFNARLQPFARAEFDRARLEGRHEPQQAYEFDALMTMAAASTGGSGGAKTKVPAKLFVRVDYAAFCRGIVEGDELCEIDGFGPVPVSVARQFAEEAFVVGLLTQGTDVVKLNHFGRQPNALQQSLLEWKAKWCQVLGCTRTKLERDHGDGWANTHETRADDLWGFCCHHHDLKTYQGYRIVESEIPGRVLLVPPDDPDPPPRE